MIANVGSKKTINYTNNISNSVMFAFDPKSFFIINTIINIKDIN